MSLGERNRDRKSSALFQIVCFPDYILTLNSCYSGKNFNLVNRSKDVYGNYQSISDSPIVPSWGEIEFIVIFIGKEKPALYEGESYFKGLIWQVILIKVYSHA